MIDINFASEVISRLKNLQRTGWVVKKVSSPESVADHSWGVALLAFLLTPDKLDKNKCLKMALLHDLQEIIVGDITPDMMLSKEAKHKQELEAVKYLSEKLDNCELLELFIEFENQQTAEAKFVKDLDKIECVMQAKYYEKNKRTAEPLVAEFSDYAQKNLNFDQPIVTELWRKIKN